MNWARKKAGQADPLARDQRVRPKGQKCAAEDYGASEELPVIGGSLEVPK